MAIVAPLDTLDWEQPLWDAGFSRIAGVDEVGRGALAGPLVAAAVVLSGDLAGSPGWQAIRDSKTMTHQRRTQAAAWIRESGADISIAAVECDEVDAIGISAANRWAMERAVAGLRNVPDLLLIDAMTLDSGIPQMGIIDGDARCLSIAAASIVAKVHRDQFMIELDRDFPGYGFARHKGYGVAAHVQALAHHGPCRHHRQSFAPVRALCNRHV